MAKGDPLRASEIERELSQEWYERWLVWRKGGTDGRTPIPAGGMIETGTRGGKRTLQSDPQAVLAHMMAVNEEQREKIDGAGE